MDIVVEPTHEDYSEQVLQELVKLFDEKDLIAHISVGPVITFRKYTGPHYTINTTDEQFERVITIVKEWYRALYGGYGSTESWESWVDTFINGFGTYAHILVQVDFETVRQEVIYRCVRDIVDFTGIDKLDVITFIETHAKKGK